MESKLRRVSEFLLDLEELSSWASGTIKLLEKGESVEAVDINPKVCCVVMIIDNMISQISRFKKVYFAV